MIDVQRVEGDNVENSSDDDDEGEGEDEQIDTKEEVRDKYEIKVKL